MRIGRLRDLRFFFVKSRVIPVAKGGGGGASFLRPVPIEPFSVKYVWAAEGSALVIHKNAGGHGDNAIVAAFPSVGGDGVDLVSEKN